MFVVVYIAFLFLTSFATFMVYRYDKRNAEFNGPSKVLRRPRVSENTLHMLSLAGGWPGALLAQRYLRHKTIKEPFQRVYWITVLLNVIVSAILLGVFGIHFNLNSLPTF